MPDQPRRGRATAIAAAPNFVVRMMVQNPKDFVAATIAVAAIAAIVGNAIFLQAGRHPSPLFGSNSYAPPSASALPSVLPRPRPIDAGPAADKPLDSRMLDSKPVQMKAHPKPAEPKTEIRVPEQKSSELKAGEPADARTEPRGGKGDRLLVQTRMASVAAPSNPPRPPAAVPTRADPLGDLITSSYRVAWVQRALSENGAGQIKATGTLGPETQAAIARFERDRKLPVTGQMSDRLLRELAIATAGRSAEAASR